jgi:hypothetical protein
VQAVHRSRKQRKLFIIRESSASCSSFKKAAQAVHRSRKQRKLFIRLRRQRKLFIRMSTSKQWQQGLSTVRDTGDGGSRGCPLRETSADSKSCRPAATAEAVDCTRRPAGASGDRRRHLATIEWWRR